VPLAAAVTVAGAALEARRVRARRRRRPRATGGANGQPHFPADGTAAGAAEWEGLGLLSGSSISDITTASALTLLCSQYSPENWGALLRQEFPELTDEDTGWLCGLTEALEPQEPITSSVEAGLAAMPAVTVTGLVEWRTRRQGK
jgi:hypothetical protein